MAIPAGGARQYPTGAVDDWVEVRGPASLATTRMQRGTWLYYWSSRGFTLVRPAGVVVMPDAGT